MAFLKGRNVQVQVAQTLGTAKTVSAITNASPGVATSTAHSLTNGSVGFFTGVGGMVQLEGQAARVANTAANSFDLHGLNTTNYSAFSGTAQFTPITAWLTMAESDSYDIGGGSADELDVTCLADVIKQTENGNLAAQTVTINIKALTAPSAAMLLLMSDAQAGLARAFRIVLQDGSVRVFRAEPSLPSESLSTGAVGTGSMSLRVKGSVLMLPA